MKRALLAASIFAAGCSGDFPALEVVVRFDAAVTDGDVSRVTRVDATLARPGEDPQEFSFDVDQADFDDRQANFYEPVEGEEGSVDITIDAFSGADPIGHGEESGVPLRTGRVVVILGPS